MSCSKIKKFISLFQKCENLGRNCFNLKILLFCAPPVRELFLNGLCCKCLFWQRWFVESFFCKSAAFFSAFSLVPENCWGLFHRTAQLFHFRHCFYSCVFLRVGFINFLRVSHVCCNSGWHQHSGSGSTGTCIFFFCSGPLQELKQNTSLLLEGWRESCS